jgi:hypothetical protein
MMGVFMVAIPAGSYASGGIKAVMPSHYEFKSIQSSAPVINCEKTLGYFEEYIQNNCDRQATRYQNICSQLRAKMKIDFKFRQLGEDTTLPYFQKIYTLESIGRAPLDFMPDQSIEFHQLYYKETYSVDLSEFTWSASTQLPVKGVLDSVFPDSSELEKSFSVSRGVGRSFLKITNRYVACAFENNKIQFNAQGLLPVYGQHPSQDLKKNLLFSFQDKIDAIRLNTKTSDAEKYFKAGIAVASIYQELVSNHQILNEEHEESAVGLMSLLLKTEGNRFESKFKSKNQILTDLLTYPTEEKNGNLEISY